MKGFVRLVEPTEPPADRYVLIGEVFIQDPVAFEREGIVEDWGNQVFKLIPQVNDIQITAHDRHHWRFEVEVTVPDVSVCYAILTRIRYEVCGRMWGHRSYRTERVTVLRLPSEEEHHSLQHWAGGVLSLVAILGLTPAVLELLF